MVKVVRAGIEEKEISQHSLIYLVTSFNFVTSALKPLDYIEENVTNGGSSISERINGSSFVRLFFRTKL